MRPRMHGEMSEYKTMLCFRSMSWMPLASACRRTSTSTIEVICSIGNLMTQATSMIYSSSYSSSQNRQTHFVISRHSYILLSILECGCGMF
ncbi:hypothetical protein BDZ89DRAFT_207485 [Hymenopellis radicata]|nr:hypothetical protein BDZ89DRAFT_207485 [Hymenopellis radicata]